jgi:outer membrane immunogenic protein
VKKILLAAAVAVSTAALASMPAHAADLAYKSTPMMQAAYNWTGFYVGLNGGGGMASADHLDPDGGVAINTRFQQAFGTVGVQSGYNYQIGSSVIGLEGDYNWVGLDKTKLVSLGDNFNGPSTANFKFSEFATLRARGGLALDRTLLYVTAGVAFAHIQNTDAINAFDFQGRPVTPSSIASEDKWKAGLAVGAGVEFALSQNWSVKGEYLYMMFPDSDAPFLNPPNGTRACSSFIPGSLFNCRMNFTESAQLARLGVNYRW